MPEHFDVFLSKMYVSRCIPNCRSGVRNGYQARCIRVWRDFGVKVLVATHNVKFMQQTEELISEANAMAPVGGIFHLAMVNIFCLLDLLFVAYLYV